MTTRRPGHTRQHNACRRALSAARRHQKGLNKSDQQSGPTRLLIAERQPDPAAHSRLRHRNLALSFFSPPEGVKHTVPPINPASSSRLLLLEKKEPFCSFGQDPASRHIICRELLILRRRISHSFIFETAAPRWQVLHATLLWPTTFRAPCRSTSSRAREPRSYCTGEQATRIPLDILRLRHQRHSCAYRQFCSVVCGRELLQPSWSQDHDPQHCLHIPSSQESHNGLAL